MNSILAQTQRLHEGQLVGPESLAADSTGDHTLELILCLILTFVLNNTECDNHGAIILGLLDYNLLKKCIFRLRKRSEHVTIICTGTLYTGLADGRIVKLEGDKVVDLVRTGKPPCGMYSCCNRSSSKA